LRKNKNKKPPFGGLLSKKYLLVYLVTDIAVEPAYALGAETVILLFVSREIW
jgi:hypothetical protein